MRRVVLAMAIAMAAVGLAAPHAAATSGCNQDGVAVLCVSTGQSQDALALNYQVTQYDGPGVYTVYYVDTVSGVASATHPVGPLSNRGVGSGTLLALFNRCYDVHLDSTAGTSLVVPSICG